MIKMIEKDMNDLITSFDEYSLDYTKCACDYYEEYLRNYQKEKLQLQNNWNELKKCVREWILYHSVCEEDYKELNVLEDVESKMQELEKGKDE